MKKLLLVVMLFVMFAVITPAYADDADGVWFLQEPSSSDIVDSNLAFVRINGGALFLAIMPLEMTDYITFFGTFDGVTGNLTQLFNQQSFNPQNGQLSMPASSTGTFQLTSPISATFTITSCVDFPQQDNCAQVGTTFILGKIF